MPTTPFRLRKHADYQRVYKASRKQFAKQMSYFFTVRSAEEMLPQTENNHCATKPARYALEMNKGWFSKHGIVAGAKISGLPQAAQ